MRRLALTTAVLAAFCAAADSRAADDPTTQNIFFRDPDHDTSARIATLIQEMPTHSVQDRTKRRRALEEIGYWSVDPLIDALNNLEPPIKCSAILVLDAIHDRRAIEPLRAAVLREVSHPYIAGFATLALGRFRDAGALEAFRTAAKTPKSMEMLKVAVPLALVKIHTPEARDLLVERLRQPAKEPVRNAELVSLGFFPEAALDASGTRPGPDLKAALENRQRRGERQSALLAYLVATRLKNTDVKPFLLGVLDSDTAPEVQGVALIGLSHSDDADVTELFAKIAARQGDDRVRELAADLLLDRADASVKAPLLQIARTASSGRLRAAAVLALGRLDDDDVRKFLLEKLDDSKPVVRAAAAVAATRRTTPASRDAARAAIEAKLKHGDPNDDVRADWEKARLILSGQRNDVRWTEVGPEVIFSDMPLDYVQRLLREVNLRLMASLDLAKIQNLQTDSELVPAGPPADVPASGDSDTPPPSGGGAGTGDPTSPTPDPPGQSNDNPMGAQRTSQFQEQRDLKVELMRNPYFGVADLPQPPTTPSGRK